MAKKTTKADKPKRAYKIPTKQTDFPKYSLKDALQIPEAIFREYAGRPTAPLKVAQALGLKPASSHFRMLTGSAAAYGLTDGAAKSEAITPTDLSKRIIKPLHDGDDSVAMKEAFLRPNTISRFLTDYDQSSLPSPKVAANVMEEYGVPAASAADAFREMIEQASRLGLITEIKGSQYVDLSAVPSVEVSFADTDEEVVGDAGSPPETAVAKTVAADSSSSEVAPHSGETSRRLKRVFITHGKNKELVEPIKELLGFGDLEPIVSTEKQTTSQPVPEKVMADMRMCGAAIIHVEGEEKVMTTEGDQKLVLNPNVLIEIGAAMALYGKRFILLTKEGTGLPSNLQGLYEVRYPEAGFDGDATIRLMKAINALKAHEVAPILT